MENRGHCGNEGIVLQWPLFFTDSTPVSSGESKDTVKLSFYILIQPFIHRHKFTK